MKNTLLKFAAASLMAGILTASAQDSYSLSISTAYNSDYYFRGTQLADAFIETEVAFEMGDFYAGLWYASPFDAADTDGGLLYANELDIFAGYGIAYNDLISFDLGITAYYYPELPSDDNPTWEPYVGVAFDTLLSPGFYIFYDITLETWTFEGSASYTVEMDEVSGIELAAFLGYVSPDEGDGAFYYGASVTYNYALSDTASFKVGASYTDGDSDLTGGNWDDGFAFTTGLSLSF